MNQPSKLKSSKLSENKQHFLFTKENFFILIAGIIFIVIGFILMIGGGSDDPTVFNEDIFNTQRLTIAPILLVIGYGLQIVAIFYKKKN